ncbi:CLAVATA3/ESR (CLE)-related protein 12-like [Mercurialis annua]|uniref:CLAVATA3/ESR (CLE)-related protein 12-like n=1 Tax=Mercurialis annua TaxID=3986 RepID=UPI00215E31BD|nr:CLAVATA3/ESR (CLE)-related protein 12-like [Mercurialis annua]
MALKIVHSLLCVVFWLSLLLLGFLELYNCKSRIGTTNEIINSTYNLHHHRRSSYNRKVLASRFDFTPFQKKQHLHDHRHDHGEEEKQMHEDKDGREIDPRYGVEKRRVPTGPNPLHH